MKKKLNICIPMAGEGKRFIEAGYKEPKPFIPIHGKSMIHHIIENLDFSMFRMNFIFIVQEEHCQKFNFEENILKALYESHGLDVEKNAEIIKINYITEGAACTVLKARKLINNDTPLLIANSDQLIDWSITLFNKSIEITNADACIPVFHNTHPKWSYAELDNDGYVIRVKEKEPISTYATAGIYWFRKGNDFVWGADEMIHKNLRVNNEFYVCPVFNELIIPKNQKVIAFPIPSCAMHGLGTPEDLQKYLEIKRG
jgi:NDP-sugar pyrophosphorylase family protein